jgi:hypothetical protein
LVPIFKNDFLLYFSALKLLQRLGKVAHDYNLSYSGGRDQEDYGPRPGGAGVQALSEKQIKYNELGVYGSMVEYMPNKWQGPEIQIPPHRHTYNLHSL